MVRATNTTRNNGDRVVIVKMLVVMELCLQNEILPENVGDLQQPRQTLGYEKEDHVDC